MKSFGNSSCEYTAQGCRSLGEQFMKLPFLLLNVLYISLQEACLALLHSPALWLVLEENGFADSRHSLEVPTSRQFDLDLQKTAYIPISRCRCTSEEKGHWSKIHEHFQHLTCFQDWIKSCGFLQLKILPSVSDVCNFRKLMSYPCLLSPLCLSTCFDVLLWPVGWLSLVFTVRYYWNFKTMLTWSNVPIFCNRFFWPDFSFYPPVIFCLDRKQSFSNFSSPFLN